MKKWVEKLIEDRDYAMSKYEELTHTLATCNWDRNGDRYKFAVIQVDLLIQYIDILDKRIKNEKCI